VRITLGVTPSSSIPVERSMTSNEIELMDEQMILRARAQLGTDIASSRVAVCAPPKNGLRESIEVTGASEAATSTPRVGAAVSILRVANMSRIAMREFSQA